MANSTTITHSWRVKITEAFRKYSAAEEALKQGMEAKSKEFVEKGANIYAKV